ncbi:MAG TPA: SpvB/TcaC N-terminal domain-containing protein [Streptosporangiaceae bacterium]|nr:SpvB/TcaC N-terminal domain-containing protein [Streptosporangiaceae bacterium]
MAGFAGPFGGQQAAAQPVPGGPPAPPSVSLPKGGGAIRDIGEKFSVAMATGTASLTVPVTTSPARSGFGPSLTLSYDSGAGNGPFGLGWKLSLPAITRKTDKGLPHYRDDPDADVFLLSGAEDLVPVREEQDGHWDQASQRRVSAGQEYLVQCYRPRVEGLFARIERWRHLGSGETHWRTITSANVTSLYGGTAESRIADPDDQSRVFSWLICETYDDVGNAMVYQYRAEDRAGVDTALANERHRTAKSVSANRYLTRVRYGNRVPWRVRGPGRSATSAPVDPGWMFDVVFDYGNHGLDTAAISPTRPWPARPDPFSTYRPGFEVRTYRRCHRVLMVHHFPDEPEVGADCLVCSTDFTYTSTRSTGMTTLASVTHTGYRRRGDSYRRESLPPAEFGYSQAVIGRDVADLGPDALANLPTGIGGNGYEWVDLDGEGVSGILARQGGAWFYKANLGDGCFAPERVLPTQPAMAGGGSRQRLLDLAGDGHLDLAELGGTVPGFYERSSERGWHPFRPFRSRPNISWDDPDLRLVDLDGDGLADVLITRDDAFTWYPSLRYEGFGDGRRAYLPWGSEGGPRVLLADPAQTVYLADMTGDGLSDLVRVRDGEVCYWPNTGFGRFGAKVTMASSPWLDDPGVFDQHRVRLADVDGSGTADLLYLHRDEVRVYFNRSGNGFSEAHTVGVGFPQLDSLTSVMVADLLGQGTACLVWSSPLPGDSGRQLRYLNLMAHGKPYLLTEVVNNLGAETKIQYEPSTRFYLADQAAGRPWVTRLPFPVYVVTRVEVIDRVNHNSFTTRYAYHHGYYDGFEREFRGFGMVEQYDAEEFAVLQAVGEDVADHEAQADLPPVMTRTWFHTGVFRAQERISRVFEHEYWQQPGDGGPSLADTHLPETLRPVGEPRRPWRLSATEAREAGRALRGTPLRQEVYALDGSEAAGRPYLVTEHNYTIELLQPALDPRPGVPQNYHAVFLTHPRESVSAHYERTLYQAGAHRRADPRVSHEVILDIDDYGNPVRSAAVGYGRRFPDPVLAADDQHSPARHRLTCTENTYTNAVELPDAHRTPTQCESRTFEVTGVRPRGPQRLFGFDELRDVLGSLRTELPYQDWDAGAATDAVPAKRLIEHIRVRYRRDDLTGPLPPGVLEPLALPYRTYRLAFDAGLVAALYGSRVTHRMLGQAGYVREGDSWWAPSGQVFYSPGARDDPAAELAYARAHFFLGRRFRDPFGHTTTVGYDGYDLLVSQTQDPLGNTVSVGERDDVGQVTSSGFDYRVLMPHLVSDPNRNRAAVAFDIFGRVAGTAVMGRPGERLGDTLDRFDPDPGEAAVLAYFADPFAHTHRLLGPATTRVLYDLDAYRRSLGAAETRPAAIAVLARQTHDSDLEPGELTLVQQSFTYSDGFGREVQHKTQAAPGPVTDGGPDVVHRWVGSEWTIFNNKGKPVRRYEPFFTASHQFEFARMAGVSAVLFYDPPGRVIATVHPDQTFEKTVFDPWYQATWDGNDTVLLDPRDDPDVGGYVGRYLAALSEEPGGWQTWYAQRIGGGLGPDEQHNAEQTALHAGTPAFGWFDTLGRTFLVVQHNRLPGDGGALDEFYRTRGEVDIEGNLREVHDALGRQAMSYTYTMAGGEVGYEGIDTGGGLRLPDVTSRLVRSWDSRGFAFRTDFDALRRPVRGYVRGPGVAGEALQVRTVYGEELPDEPPGHVVARNLRTRVAVQYDNAGVDTFEAYDFKGNLLQAQRRLTAAYREVPDWNGQVDVVPHAYRSATSYDALNRPASATSPDGSVTTPHYNAASLLERMDVRLRGATQPTTFVVHLDYNARAQRTAISYGNGTRTAYTYDPLTFRLVQLTTERGSRRLQDLHYTYDPVGNCTLVHDAAQQRAFFRNRVVEPSSRYHYDAVYRLFEATGREHCGQASDGAVRAVAPGASDTATTGLPQPGDGIAMARYTERYSYDAVGNLRRMAHRTADPRHGGWTRDYHYREPSLLQPGHRGNRLSSTGPAGERRQHRRYRYDEQGNTTSMPGLGALGWDPMGRLHMTSRHVSADGFPAAPTYYVYDAAGQRARKVTEAGGGHGGAPRPQPPSRASAVSERVYLGAFEVYRRYGADGRLVLERETLHLLDGLRRIAMVETRTHGTDDGPGQLIRYQLADHLESSVLELDEQARVITFEEYYPYGATSYQAVRSRTETPKRYRFTGKERDTESGLYYHGARYYIPWLGRWASCDQPGVSDDQSPYCYAADNPLRYNDPTGLDPNDLLSPDQVGEGPDYSYQAVNPDTGKYVKVASGGPMVINGESVAPQQYKSYVAPRAPGTEAAPKKEATQSSSPARQTIAQKREEDWSAAKAGMWNRVVDVAEVGLKLSFPTAAVLAPPHLLDWARAAPPTPTGNELRDYELRGNYESGGTFVDVVQAGVSFVPVGEILEGVTLAAGKLPALTGTGSLGGGELISFSEQWAAAADTKVPMETEELANISVRGPQGGKPLGTAQGRENRLEALAENEWDENQPAHVRGWLENERRRLATPRPPGLPPPKGLRNPPGYVQGHLPATPAREGFDYFNAKLTWSDINKMQELIRRRFGWP